MKKAKDTKKDNLIHRNHPIAVLYHKTQPGRKYRHIRIKKPKTEKTNSITNFLKGGGKDRRQR